MFDTPEAAARNGFPARYVRILGSSVSPDGESEGQSSNGGMWIPTGDGDRGGRGVWGEAPPGAHAVQVTLAGVTHDVPVVDGWWFATDWDAAEAHPDPPRVTHAHRPEPEDAPRVGGGLEAPEHDPPSWGGYEVFGIAAGVVLPVVLVVAGLIALGVFVDWRAVAGVGGIACTLAGVWALQPYSGSRRRVRDLRQGAEDAGHPDVPDDVLLHQWETTKRLAAGVMFLAAVLLLAYAMA